MAEQSDTMVPYRPEPLEWAAPEQAEVSIVGMLLQRWVTALIVSLLCAALSLSAVWLVLKPKYEVGASIHVAPVERHILFTDPTQDVAVNYRQYVGTEAASILSPVVIEAALNEPEVRTLPLVVASVDPVATIQDKVQVQQRQGTEWLDVTMTGRDPEQMVLIVNAVIDSYLRRRNEQQRSWDDRILRSLRQEEAELEAKLQVKARQLQQTAVTKGLSSAEPSGAMLDTWMAELQKLLAEAKKTRAIAEANMASRKSDLELQVGDEASDERVAATFEAFLASHPEMQQLKSELRAVELDALDDARLGRGPNHPDVQGRDARIAAMRRRIDVQRQDLQSVFASSRKQQLQLEIIALDRDVRSAAVEVRVFEEELARLGSMRSDVASQLFELENLRHERQSLEASLAQVREKIWTVDVEQNRTARVSLASEARVPTAPNKDIRFKFSAIACMLSVFCGLGAALMRARMDTRLREPEQVAERLGIRVLGSVQLVNGVAAQGNGAAAHLARQLAAPMRGISAALLAGSTAAGSHSRLITSPTPGSGKSSLAVNLARTLASSERRVLLIDADNNRLGATRSAGLLDKPGLFDLLSGTASKEEVIHATDLGFLSVLPAGARNERFGELLTAKHTQALLAKLFAGYDEVIIDSPPVLATSDAVVLATLVDEVVLVLRAGRSTRQEASAAQHSLAAVGANVVGVILNAVDPKRSRYGYGYGYGYAYAGEE